MSSDCLGDAKSLGYMETSESDEVVINKVELSAPIIDNAFKAMAAAILAKEAADLRRLETMFGVDSESWKVRTSEVRAEYGVQLAKNECDRVTTLMNFMNIEAIFKASS